MYRNARGQMFLIQFLKQSVLIKYKLCVSVVTHDF